MTDEVKRHNVIHRSLREYMIPMAKWFEEMKRVECTGPYSLDIAEAGEALISDNKFTIHYPYKEPLWCEILDRRKAAGWSYKPGDPIQFTDEEYGMWVNGIYQRINPFFEHCISDDLITELDNKIDTGIIIHNTTGALFPFEYSKIKCMMTVAIPVSIKLMMAKYSSPEKMDVDPDHYMEILKNLTTHAHEFDMMYMPEFNTIGGDDYTNPGDYGRISYKAPIPVQDVMDITKYLSTMISSHAKCILVP